MSFAHDLQALGVSPAVANAYVTATAPVEISEHGQGGGSTQGPGANTSNATAGVGGVGGPSPGARDANATTPGAESFPDQPPAATVGDAASGTGDGSTTPALDWQAYLQNWGFPPDVIAQLKTIFATYSDPAQAQAAALAYVRGTPWYSQTFPGIQQGEKLGLFGDEQGYRQYVNQLNDASMRYNGRAATGQEVADWIAKGMNGTQFANHLQGQAYIAANGQEIQYDLGNFGDKGATQATPQQLSDLGDNTAGLGNFSGTQIQAKLDKARSRLATIFQGQLASPSLALLNNGRVATSGNAGNPSDLQT